MKFCDEKLLTKCLGWSDSFCGFVLSVLLKYLLSLLISEKILGVKTRFIDNTTLR